MPHVYWRNENTFLFTCQLYIDYLPPVNGACGQKCLIGLVLYPFSIALLHILVLLNILFILT